MRTVRRVHINNVAFVRVVSWSLPHWRTTLPLHPVDVQLSKCRKCEVDLAFKKPRRGACGLLETAMRYGFKKRRHRRESCPPPQRCQGGERPEHISIYFFLGGVYGCTLASLNICICLPVTLKQPLSHTRSDNICTQRSLYTRVRPLCPNTTRSQERIKLSPYENARQSAWSVWH